MYQALYRKWRPRTFDDVVGQDHITETLKQQVAGDRLSHAYLFTGTRGTGKTTCAKILARAVNCQQPENGNPCNKCPACLGIENGSILDVLELDAASNNGVDQVRALRDEAVYTPAAVRKRVYIVDEVHMLSLSAFNALLKIIEEPPEHLLFILATTELHKVPATILSRCQRFSFRRISQEDIAARLQYVAYQESIDLDDGAARVLARLADGGMRDGLSLLDQCASASTGEVTAEKVYECLGIAGEQKCGTLLGLCADHDTAKALALFSQLYSQGKDIGALLDELESLLRDLLVMKTAPKAGITMLSGVAPDSEVMELTKRLSTGEIVRMMELVQQTVAGFNRSAGRRMDAELCIVELCRPELSLDASALNARLTRLEDQLKSGAFVAAPKAAAQPEAQTEPEEELPPIPDDSDAPPDAEAQQLAPANSDSFWLELVGEIRQELSPPVSGFFVATPTAPVRGVLRGNILELRCQGSFPAESVSAKPVQEVIARKAAARLGRAVQIKVVDVTQTGNTGRMEQLMNFGRAHQDIVKIR